jgi:5-methylcytosine-specific restriction endonuclease McrA
MTKSEYAKLLTDPRWNEVRIRILKRDNFTCRSCKASGVRLNVHHKIYVEGKMPWEVPDKFLRSLCDECHAKAHEGRLISSFIRKKVPKLKRV